MAQVFISYAREDRGRAEDLATILERWGWDAWWDRDLIAGEAFGRRLEEQIESADAVIVLWSRHSVESDWVRAEAAAGAERKVLVPIALETVRVPMRFRLLHTLDMSRWDDDDDPRLDEVQRALVAKTGLVPADDGDRHIDVSPGLGDRWAARVTRWMSAPYLTWLGVGAAAGVVIVAAVVAALVLWGDDDTGGRPDDEFPLASGSVGPRVEAVQGWLADLGLDVGREADDETLGPQTSSAVREWQREAGRDDDGEIDFDDFRALHLDADPAFAPAAVTGCEAETLDEVDACDGELVRAPGDIAVYLVTGGERVRIPDPETLACFGTFDDVRIVPPATVDSYRLADEPAACES